MQFDNLELRVTPSIGVAIYPSHAMQFSKLYKAADQALYDVKGNGRAAYAMASEAGGETSELWPEKEWLENERLESEDRA